MINRDPDLPTVELPSVAVIPLDSTEMVIVCDAVAECPSPPYRAVSRGTCRECETWCWLGVEADRVVRSREALPLCIACATTLIGPGDYVRTVDTGGVPPPPV